ncbi:MAG: bifunctional phosphoribosyl-AMP cyclohydrolase/phosphoribosyl-ATP diphosphatase HisIE [Ornithinimicrobium sp.]
MSLHLPEPHTVDTLAFDDHTGLIPAIVQDSSTAVVLMLGYCDRQAVTSMLATGFATFYSRSRQQQWVKGETSGNTLQVKSIEVDCDRDTLLLHSTTAGPTCHTGAVSCFTDDPRPSSFLAQLDALVAQRDLDRPAGSYTTSLFEGGVRRVAQKVGEEGVETALAAVAQGEVDLLAESADLVYHLIVLLRSKGLSLSDVESVLRQRHAPTPQS